MGLGPATEAIVPASLKAAAFGMVLLGIWALLEAGPIPTDRPLELIGALIMGALGLAVGWVGATFVVAFYLVVFGLPVALLLGDRIRRPWALGISLADAVAGAVIAATGTRLGLLGHGGTVSPEAIALTLGFALPAGYFYRRAVIALRDTADLF